MDYYLGLDIGSVNAKITVIDENGNTVHHAVTRVAPNPAAAVNSLIEAATSKIPQSSIAGVGVSGSGHGVVPKEHKWTKFSSSLAVAAGLLKDYPETKTIIQIGGQSSLVVELEEGLKKPWKAYANPLCAAGTGRFLEQQAYRLDISMEDFASLALKCKGSAPRIAARCSVFAKSDLIHLQQKGVSLEMMLYSLCESIARMVASLKKGEFKSPIYFTGGVAANLAMTKALKEVLSARNGYETDIRVPEGFLYTESFGVALLARGKEAPAALKLSEEVKVNYYQTPKLETVDLPGNGQFPGVNKVTSGYLGVDVGSTSTKAVILDDNKEVLAKSYKMTAGRPVDAIRQVFESLMEQGAEKVDIKAVGITGSGRYLVGDFIGADLIKNEITAQTRAAAEIDNDADIIEIGGQDSKLIIKRNGVVVDYQMNKACAAGTGSFIDELAEMLGVNVKNGDFAKLALSAPHTIDLGTRCAAFIGQAVSSAKQEGVGLPVITASLTNSVAKNYLSKVLGSRKLGDRVILTGAVFYNQAVAAAFKQQLKDKDLLVAEHREVSGAIGSALLAAEVIEGRNSGFKGFANVVGRQVDLTTFTCKSCDNNCAITRMKSDDKKTYYGSRCDKYDAESEGREAQETYFDRRAELLFADYDEKNGAGIAVGVPRALLVYDYAPLLIGFLNWLGVHVVLSSGTNKYIMEQSVELSYTDSCFPLKLLHGHTAAIKDKVDYILYPSSIRMGGKEGDENQKYACPLVQASPYIVRHVLGLGDRLLTPIIDFSHGNELVTESFADAAVAMGFKRDKGRQAAQAGIQAQKNFEEKRANLGRKMLEELKEEDKLGVVLISRSYMSQDSGTNLGIAEKLAQLGVVPLPLDFLPLDLIDPKRYSDRPYWFYESKFIAAAAIAASNPKLYGLIVSNFGCGPNSFIINEIEDIMGEKPLGQLEIDEHAAEAGIVTRLEAFVDTIKGFSGCGKEHESGGDAYRGVSTVVKKGKTLVIPKMSPHMDVLVPAINTYGANAILLPEPNERNIIYSNEVTSGTECLPYRVTLGDFMRFCRDDGHKPHEFEGLMAGAFGPCRLGKYVVEQDLMLKKLGYDLPLITTVANNAYSELDLEPGFRRLAFVLIDVVDGIQRLLWRYRPYEKEKGSADALFKECLERIATRVQRKEEFEDVLRRAANDFKALADPELPRRPLVGINGEIYLRSNDFSNCHLAQACEEAGLEVAVSPVGEWIRYVVHRQLEDALADRKPKKIIKSYLTKFIRGRDEHRIERCFEKALDEKEPSIAELLARSRRYLSPKCGSEAVLSIGGGVGWLESPHFAGVISVMPHGCMPGGIVAAMSSELSAEYGKPWINVIYDGFMESNNAARISEFAERVKFTRENVEGD